MEFETTQPPSRQRTDSPPIELGRTQLVRSGAELVELSERFYRGIFLGMVGFVGLSAAAALILLPLRASGNGAPIVGFIAGGLTLAAVPLAIRQRRTLYLSLRGDRRLELVPVAVAAALVTVVFPLHSQLWWPSCALLMLLGVVAPLRRVLGYCLIVLAANLFAHIISGDIGHTPAVSIIGLWIGYPFWSCTVAAVTGQMASQLLRHNTTPSAAPLAPRRVSAWVAEHTGRADRIEPAVTDIEHHRPPAGVTDASEGPAEHPSRPVVNRLTARQLQVVALLADGLRYREVADCLGISERQVQRHVSDAVARAGVRTAAELVGQAIAGGLVPPSDAGSHPVDTTAISAGNVG